MKYYILFFLLLFPGLETYAQIYKCEDPLGRINYSDTPCAGTGSVYEAKNTISEVRAFGPSSSEKAVRLEVSSRKRNTSVQSSLVEPCKEFNATKLRNLMVQDKIAVGMTEENVKRAWGNPTKVYRSSNGHDQWVYRSKKSTSYVYFENGCVSSWQT